MNNSGIIKVLSLIPFGTVVVSLMDNITEVLTILTLFVGIVSGVVSVILKVITWYNNAIKDGEITADEVKELIGEVKEEIDNVVKN